MLIGIYIDSDASAKHLSDTWYYLNANPLENSTVAVEWLLLCDSVNPQVVLLVEQMNATVIRLTQAHRGRPAYFNRLIDHPADYYLLIDCGLLMAEHCIDWLVASFNHDLAIGLVGPSSNNGWNQQSIYRDTGVHNTVDNVCVLERAQAVTRRFNSHPEQDVSALLESCFMVSKAVVAAIGYVDESYMAGYCWEIDYQQRAVMAGFSARWIAKAYAHRSHLPDTSGRNSSAVKNNRYYQRKFANNGMAPVEFYQHKSNHQPSQPLISCIMPTRGRAHYVAQAIVYFNSQTYPNTELIIVYEQPSDLPENVTKFDNVYLTLSPNSSSIGLKRNLALAQCCGDIITHWDDDDWYSVERLTQQAKPLLANQAQISALYNTRFLALATMTPWHTTAALYLQMFVEGVHGGTLMYKAENIGSSQFLDISLREDAMFLQQLMDSGARLAKVDGYKLFVYIRHPNNSWAFECGKLNSTQDWYESTINDLPSANIEFYVNALSDTQKSSQSNRQSRD